MIVMVQPLNVGNALRLILRPPADALRWRVLRRADANFVGPVDPDAVVVHEGADGSVLDTLGLQNDQQVHYCVYYFTDAALSQFTASNVASGIPRSTYTEQTTDVLTVLRDRLSVGLAEEVRRGALAAHPDTAFVSVLNEAPSLEQSLFFPLVTLHLESEDPGDRGIGELLAPDAFDRPEDMWRDSEGWMANVRITVIGWALNADTRIELRKSLRRLMLANLPVFAAQGWNQVEFSMQDVDSINGEFIVPMFQALGNFTCSAPVVVGGEVDPVRTVEVSAETF